MKLTPAFSGVGLSQALPAERFGSPHVSPLPSAPAGGWKTTISPTFGSLKRLPSRLTSTRWPTFSVGSIEPDGMR